ncbi:NitT/TauT family transport system permease protein [Paenibacillus mucilaginosus]|uniref:ABC transporter permease n=1 Tax=Paenibacillus mucilaginosus TaxID=61624 RepID=UPI003D24D643
MNERSNRRDTRWILCWAGGLLLLWEACAWLLHQSSGPAGAPAASKLPYPHLVLAAIAAGSSELAGQGAVTFGNAALGFAAGALIGYLLAIGMSLSRTAERIFAPYAVASQMVPIIGLAPIVYGILHQAETARVLMAAYVTFFPVTVHALRGLKSVQPGQLELMRSLAASRWVTYRKLILPAALPGLFTGLKIAAPLAITASVVVELMGAPDGIGVLMVSSLYYGSAQVYTFWSTVIVSMGIGLVAYGIVSWIERRAAPWQPEFRARRGSS